MPQPDIRDVHVDQLMTMFSHAYMNEAENYISDKVFPIVPVRKQAARIAKYTKADWFKDDASLRSPGTESAGSGFTVDTTDTYFCDNFAVHKDIPDEVRENADAPFDVDLEAVRLVTDKLMLRREVAWATDFFTSSSGWGTSSDKTAAPWSDYALGDPIGDVETGKDGIHKITSREANTMVIGREVWTKLKHHPDFIERIKYTQKGVLTTDIVASILEIPRLMVGKAIRNTYDEGQTDAAAAYSYVMGDSALLLHVAPAPALLTPSAGYTFHWANFGALSFIRRIRNDFTQVDRVEGHTYFDHKAVGTDLGYFLYNLVA